jgi:hypothetical protein
MLGKPKSLKMPRLPLQSLRTCILVKLVSLHSELIQHAKDRPSLAVQHTEGWAVSLLSDSNGEHVFVYKGIFLTFWIHRDCSLLSSSYLSFGSQLKKTSKSLLSRKSSHGTSSSSGLRFIDLILSAKLIDL